VLEAAVGRAEEDIRSADFVVRLDRTLSPIGWACVATLVARQLGETSVMFLVHPTLTLEEVDKTCRILREVGGMALAHSAAYTQL